VAVFQLSRVKRIPQHRDKLIVLDVSKEQLEAAPAYRKLGEKQAADN
jgi:hypothetical protein